MTRRWWVFVGVLLLLAGAVGSWSGASAAAPSTPDPGGAGLERYVIVPSESPVTYRVGEVFFDKGNQFNVAVGTTNAVQGEVLIDRVNPRRSRVGAITVDISQFTSDRPRRDNAIRTDWLESQRYPMAVFTPTGIEGLPDTYTPGQEIPVQISGTLKIREVTRPSTFAVKLRLDGNTLTGEATTMILMTDFGFEPPSILGILKAQNEVKLEFHFVARRQ